MTAATGTATASHRTALASILTVGGRLLSRVIDLLALIVLARLLTPADFGLIGIAMSLIFIVEAIMELPVSQVLLVERDITRPMMDTAFTLSLLRGIVLAIVIGAIAWPFTIAYGDMRLLPLVLALSIAPAVRGISNPRLALYCRDLDFRRTVATEIFGKLGSLAASTAVALATGSYWALAIGTIASPVIAAGLSFVLAPYLPTLSLREWPMFRNFLGWLSGAQLFSAFAWQIDRLVLGWLTIPAVVGRFTMADNLASIPGQVLLGPILGPLSAGLVAVREDPKRLQQAYLKTLSVVTLVGFPVLTGTALLAQPLVSLALDDKWRSVAPVLQWLALAGIPGLLWTPLNALALALRRSNLIFNRQLTDFLVKVPLVIAAGWLFLVPGIAAARGIAALVLAALAIDAARRLSGVSAWAQVKAIGRPAIGCMAMAAVVLPALQLAPPGLSKIGLVLAIGLLGGLGALIFAGTTLLLWHGRGRPDGAEAMLLGLMGKMVLRGRFSPRAAPRSDAPLSTAETRDRMFAIATASNKSTADPAASSVYRILDILTQANLVQPVHPAHVPAVRHRETIRLTCLSCKKSLSLESPIALNAIHGLARAADFRMAAEFIDVAGHCASCRPHRASIGAVHVDRQTDPPEFQSILTQSQITRRKRS